MADGGEGTLDAVLSRGGQRADDERQRCRRAAARRCVRHRRRAGGTTAIVEAAQIVGITDADGIATPSPHARPRAWRNDRGTAR
jgi:glycerate kinase